jgi:hypothetical protein
MLYVTSATPNWSKAARGRAHAPKVLASVRRKLGNKASEADLEAAHYIVLFTTVRVERMTTAMCLELYRLRRQMGHRNFGGLEDHLRFCASPANFS